MHKQHLTKLSSLYIFGIAFGFVEATVVYYLRHLMITHAAYTTHYKTLLNLGFMTFIKPLNAVTVNPHIYHVEMFREAATIIMLLAISFIAGSNRRQRIGAFLVSFACWDIMYYVFLKVLENWPATLFTKDVFFLIPVPWIGPVITPVVISTILLILGTKLYLSPQHHKH